jgi:hypothetical protein
MQKGINVQKQREKRKLTVKVQVPRKGYARLLQLVGNDQGLAIAELEYYLDGLWENINPQSNGYDPYYTTDIVKSAAEELQKRRSRA